MGGDLERLTADIDRLKRDHIGAHRVSVMTIQRLEKENERLRSLLQQIENHELRDHEDYEAIKDLARSNTGGE